MVDSDRRDRSRSSAAEHCKATGRPTPRGVSPRMSRRPARGHAADEEGGSGKIRVRPRTSSRPALHERCPRPGAVRDPEAGYARGPSSVKVITSGRPSRPLRTTAMSRPPRQIAMSRASVPSGSSKSMTRSSITSLSV